MKGTDETDSAAPEVKKQFATQILEQVSGREERGRERTGTRKRTATILNYSFSDDQVGSASACADSRRRRSCKEGEGTVIETNYRLLSQVLIDKEHLLSQH